MAERPILFSAPMVRALLDGRKTQTRRVIKGVPSWDHYGRDIMDWSLSGIHQAEDTLVGTDRWALDVQTEVDDHSRRIIRCPYGAPGDLLWVREAFSGPWRFRDVPPRDWRPGEWPDAPPLWFWADGDPTAGDWTRPKPSIHMPRWASRITLRITDVRVERLNEISPADAIAEGIRRAENDFGNGPSYCDYAMGDRDDTAEWFSSPIDSYRTLWKAINGAGSWAANPWVWAVSFERAV